MFAERLVYFRNKVGLTQEELSKRLGMARTTYQGYENGKREPDIDTLERIAKFYETSVDDMLGIESKKPSFSKLDLADDNILDKVDLQFEGKPINESAFKEAMNYLRVKNILK